MEFINERLFDVTDYGFKLGPSFDVYAERLRSGVEVRNLNNDDVVWKGDAEYGHVSQEEFDLLLATFMATRSIWRSFRVKNWLDFEVLMQDLPTVPVAGSSTPVQIIKRYDIFGPDPYFKKITKPVVGTLVLLEGGDVKGVTVSDLTGLMIPNTPWSGETLTVQRVEYDLPMRFDMEWMPFSYEDWSTRSGSVKLIEDLFA